VLVPSRLAPDILRSGADGSLKAVLAADGHYVEVAVPDRNVLFDVDGPEDFRELATRFERTQIPTEVECSVILHHVCCVSGDTIRHCLKVSDVATTIGKALSESGLGVDLEIIKAAAMLHDVAKGKPRHDVEAGRMLRSMGFDAIADIVAQHMDLPENSSDLRMEVKVVFVADKLVRGTDTVTIEERYGSAARTAAAAADVEGRITERMTRALKVAQEIEALLGRSLDDLLRSLS
jgi:putative nucleotidyltransferase with HDIG domain